MEIYQDENLIVFEKPAGIAVLKEGNIKKSFADIITKSHNYLKKVERNGIVHRLDKETSGILLVAKSNESLLFFQKQFKTRDVEKEYFVLVLGKIAEEKGAIEALIGRSPADYRKQKAYSLFEPGKGNKREAITKYEVEERFDEYTFLKARPKTGRKHQIRCHFAHIGHPVAGDSLYGFKNQLNPRGLTRLFLHACRLEIKMPSGEIKEFKSELPEELKKIIQNLRKKNG